MKITHGTVSGYKWYKCKCDECTLAHTEYYRHRKTYRYLKSVRESGQRLRKRARDLIHKLKDIPCMDCGVEYPHYVMDFDHRDPSDKLFEINGSAANRSKANIELEIAKCDLLCANCHRIRTWGINLILD